MLGQGHLRNHDPWNAIYHSRRPGEKDDMIRSTLYRGLQFAFFFTAAHGESAREAFVRGFSHAKKK
jgi:hypothetical protein